MSEQAHHYLTVAEGDYLQKLIVTKDAEIERLRVAYERMKEGAVESAAALNAEIERLRTELKAWHDWWDQMPPGCGPVKTAAFEEAAKIPPDRTVLNWTGREICDGSYQDGWDDAIRAKNAAIRAKG